MIGAIACATPTVVDDTHVQVVIPANAVDGPIILGNAAGTGASTTPFDVVDPYPEEFVIIGDSTAGTHASGPAISTLLYTPAEAATRPGVANLAYAGDGIVTARARWDASPYKGKSTVKATIIMLGINDAASILTGSPPQEAFDYIATYYTPMFTDMRATNPDADLILSTLVPCAAGLSTHAADVVALMQAAIIGSWSTGTGRSNVDLRSALDANNDGTIDSNLTTDNIHPTLEARQIIANGWHAHLVTLGRLPPP
jgi:lysophospholipase L1-like esterase